MADKKTNAHSCLMDENDEKGDGNLCCCFVLDEHGQYQDPCHTPVDRCCLAGLSESDNRR